MTDITAFVPLRDVLPWPQDTFPLSAPEGELDVLDRIGVTGYEVVEEEGGSQKVRVGVALLDEIALQVPGLDFFALVFGSPDPDAGDESLPGATFDVEVGLGDPVSFGIANLSVALRLKQDLLRPVVRGPDGLWVPATRPDGTPRPFEMRLVGVNLSVDLEGKVDVSFPGGDPGIDVGAFMIGETGVVVETMEPITLRLSDGAAPPPGREPGWRGVRIPKAAVYLPDGEGGTQAEPWLAVDFVELGFGDRREGGTRTRLAVQMSGELWKGETGVTAERAYLEVELASRTGDFADWKSLMVDFRLTADRLRVTGLAVPGGAISGDLQLVFRDGAVVSAESYLRRHEPDDQHLSELGIQHVHLDRNALAVTWEEPRINYWLEQLAPGLFDDADPTKHTLTLRVVFGSPVKEVRFDWHVQADAPRVFRLPGVDVTPPGDVRLSLLLGPGGSALSNLALAVTFAKAGAPLRAESSFAWDRGDDRELQSDEQRQDTDPPLLSLALAPKVDAVTLVVMEMDLSRPRLPSFLRQLGTPLGDLDYDQPATLGQVTVWDPRSLDDDRWSAVFKINAEKAFALPFLKEDAEQPEEGQHPQAIRIDGPSTVNVELTEGQVTVPFGVTVTMGPIQLATEVEVGFNWERFALVVDHPKGLDLLSERPELLPGEHLGLSWALKGAPVTNRRGEPRFKYLTLVTERHNYQLVQAEGASFEVAYRAISEEPITFRVSGFALTAKGISLTAEVTDQPAKLNGLDTRFRFGGSRLEIRDNRIRDFTLAGSGPLPPALVGDATADVALQFGERGGALTLIAGSAKLQGNKALDCRGTRFRFSVDALGVKFVNDGRFHLYFTLTGSAEFVPSDSDDANGALALLGKIKIDLVDAPLTGDVRVLGKHVRFLVELPKPKTFSFLGAFDMELRGIGFVPQAEVFGGDAAMMLTGQLKFAQGAGDTPDSRTDVHTLYIGLPRPGSILPRIHFKELPVNLNVGSAFRLNGTVEFFDTAQEKGFSGEGVLQIQGLPTIAASFAFLRVRRDENSPWQRAWFIYLEVRRVSFPIPYVNLYLREVGLGFGYRYTLASIKEADRENDVRKLLASLKALSRTQGDLSKRDRWQIDLEEPGQDPRWTIVLRAMISQTSASTSPLRYEEAAERDIPCTFLFDAVIAFRSDLTFFMAVRAWLNANYHDYVTDYKGLRGKPLFSGFVLLSVRQKRLLANLSSNPQGQLGAHPRLPDFVEKALTGAQFSATMLVEPGLLHYEMGWPNMLRWSTKVGPLNAEFRGGFIFRISKKELVTGASFLARASLKFEAKVDFKLVGARVAAEASLAYGARYIGVVDFRDPVKNSALYAGVGIEVRIRVSLEFWIKIPLLFKTIKKSFRFALAIDFTAGLEVGFVGVSTDGIGLRGHGTLSVRVMGHRLQMNVRVGLNEGAVTKALNRTKPYLNLGLEAADVEAIPGTRGTGSLAGSDRILVPRTPVSDAPLSSLRSFALAPEAGPDESPAHDGPVDELPPSPALAAGELPAEGNFALPDYTAFVVRPLEAGAWTHFVLFPQAEGDGAAPETGFLPAPPLGAEAESDFALRVPRGAGESWTLERYDPASGSWVAVPAGEEVAWRARWDAPVAEGTRTELGSGATEDADYRLREYLLHAFVTADRADGETTTTLPWGDPEAIPAARALSDERVHDPSEAAFEAAVRGAEEQFRGSPFFRRDAASEYERALDAAFRETTTIYHPTGRSQEEDGGAEAERERQNQQAHQLRGMIVHDLVSDLREYAASSAAANGSAPERAVAFALGLVFRVRGTALPAWLDRAPEGGDAALPEIRQRRGPGAAAPSGEGRRVRTFNVRSTDFSLNPPRFGRVQQLTDASTIAITWDLAWERRPEGIHSDAQAEPEQHLMHYAVRRRALSGTEREAVFTIKPADALFRAEDGLVQALRPRFQLVDHFTHETPEEVAALPAEGRSYLYTITPVDFAGNPGRPLTVVATRYPNEPPRVPVDGELVVRYELDPSVVAPEQATEPEAPRVMEPAGLRVEWSEPAAPRGAPEVAVGEHRLVFRRDTTLPIGSYGLDASTQGPRSKHLPTTNARPLPTDVKVVLDAKGPRQGRWAEIGVQALKDAGIFPADGAWRPESWRVFFQTVSANGVPSALAPVQLLLRVEPSVLVGGPGAAEVLPREERRPAELEWIPFPVRFPLLPPEDERATPGTAHVPVPLESGFRFGPETDLGSSVAYRAHPRGQRAVRFRWNQGPSDRPAYPLDLNAGFHLLELDVDAHTAETFASGDALSRAVRTLQEVQMVPAEDLLLSPSDTLATNQWEAWYPSAIRRRRPASQLARGTEIVSGPWHSWRESALVWPEWPGLTDGAGTRSDSLHPFLRFLVEALEENRDALVVDEAAMGTFNVDLQVTPPIKPGNLADFFAATAPSTDPHGWGALQRFGLSVAFSLRDEATGAVLGGDALLDALRRLMRARPADPARAAEIDAAWARWGRHLHVETLFQPGRSVELGEAGADAGALLGVLQLSLRPALAQTLTYGRAVLRGEPGSTAELVFTLAPDAPVSLVVPTDPGAGQVELEALPGASAQVARGVRIPLGGEAILLLRGGVLPEVGVRLKEAPRDRAALETEFAAWVRLTERDGTHAARALQPLSGLSDDGLRRLGEVLGDAAAVAVLLGLGAVEPFAASDEHSLYFTVPAALAADFEAREPYALGWRAFRAYAEALNSTDPDVGADERIVIPSGAGIAAVLPDFLAWSQRFFDHGGDVAVDPNTMRAATAEGPWLVTAYPRVGSPAVATPDASGRLTHDHLLEDRYAHAFRYYVRPFGRYDLLWDSFRTSPALFPGLPKLPVAAPDPEAGGLDVVLERTQPVAMPVLLGSRRLDPPAEPGRAVAPGTTWEVLVGQHPEQALVEKNATLARQMGFQQVAFTLLRRFSYPEWPARLSAAVGSAIEVAPVQDRYPDAPSSYPPAPDHLDLDGGVSDETARALDLPLRLGRFAEGAMALRWEGLPFFYEHRLLLAAQTAGTVSGVNETVQRDFEYRTPAPEARVEGASQGWTPPEPFGGGEGGGAIPVDARQLQVPLKRLWDSLPDSARAQWEAEAPDPADGAGTARKPASLPDPEVVYQVVEAFTGNVEVQAELFWDAAAGSFARRQLGRHFLVDLVEVTPPPADRPQGDFVLRATLQPVAEEVLSRGYGKDSLPAPTLHKVAFEGKKLVFAGTMTAADRDALAALVDEADRAAIERIHQEGFSAQPVSGAVPLPPELDGSPVTLEAADEVTLVWPGPLSEAQRTALLALPGDDEFRGAVAALADAVKPESPIARAAVTAGLDRPLPAVLGNSLQISADAEAGTYTGLAWTGPLYEAQREALDRWTGIAAFRGAVAELVEAMEAATVSVPLPEGAVGPDPSAIPAVLGGRLSISPATIQWTGRLRTPAERQALAALDGDDAFDAALAQLLGLLDAHAASIAFTIPVRPAQESLPAELRDRLVIGRARLRWHGVMPAEALEALREAFPEAADRAAAERLYLDTLNAGMRSRELRVRARRGSAAPSDLFPIGLPVPQASR